MPNSMMHIRGVSIVKSIFEAGSEHLAQSELLRLSLRSGSREFFRVPSFRSEF